MSDLVLVALTGEYYVNRLDIDAVVPEPAPGAFWSVTRTAEEISIVCPMAILDARVEGPWSAFRIAGTLDFTLTGILHRILGPLAAAQIGIFALSTFDTDYVLVPLAATEAAVQAWNASGFPVTD